MMLMTRTLPVRATALPPPAPKPKKSIQIAKKLKKAIEHASLICVNYEDTKECGIAWDQVEELSAALNDAIVSGALEEPELIWFDEASTREYDV